MCIIFLFSILALSAALPSASVSDAQKDNERTKPNDCTKGVLDPACLKIEAISLIDKLESKKEIVILPGVSIVQEENRKGRRGKDLGEDLDQLPQSTGLDKSLLYKLGDYLDSHSIKLKMFEEEGSGSQGEARKKIKGIGKKGGGILALAMLMKGTMMSLGIGALALLAGKALLTAVMSLVLSAVLGLKALASGKSTTYEIVTKPVYSQSHSHSTGHEDVGYGHSAYGRSFGER